MKNGQFITFEGGDGAGKTTLIDAIYQTLVSEGKSVLKTRAPGGSPAGQEIRKLLLNPGEISLTPRCELLLFLADRAEHVEHVILPALKKGQIVLCDRYNDSTLAYQGGARGFDEKLVRQLCNFATGGLQPALTLYLDLDPRIGLERLKKMGLHKDRIESEELHFHEKIRQTFHKIAKQETQRFHLLDASKKPEEVYQGAMRWIYDLCG